jgi:hypothetical protein
VRGRLTQSELEGLFDRKLISRNQFITALSALGVTAAGLEALFGSGAKVEADRDRAATANERYLVVMVMDGFRADYASLAPMHHLHALMARGMTYDTAWVGHLEAETPTGHATIGTGVYPRKHGVIGFGWRDVASGAFNYMPTDLRQIRAGALTQTIARGGVPTISDLIHHRRQKDLTVSVSGEKFYASAAMGAGANYVLYGKDDAKGTFRPVIVSPSVPPQTSDYRSVHGQSDFSSQDLFSSDLAIQFVRTLRPRALFVNLPNVDIAGHYFGGMISPHDMVSIIKGADYAIGRIVAEYTRLGLLDKTVFVVTADHGMAGNRHIVPIHPMYAAVAAHAPGGYLDEEFRVSMGSVWLRQLTDDRALAAALVAKHFPGVEGALYKVASGPGWAFTPDPSTRSRLGPALTQAYVNLANTEACPSGPEVILPYTQDTIGLTLTGRKRWGQHGGFTWGVQHIPLTIAGPGVRHGSSHFPAKLVDVAPTIERLLGLPIPNGVDGVPLFDALANGTPAERAAQQAAQGQRLPDVQALRAHALAHTESD